MDKQKSRKKRKAYYRKCAAASKKSRVNDPNNSQTVVPRNLQPAHIETYRLLNHTLDEISGKCDISKPEKTGENQNHDPVDKDSTVVDSESTSVVADEKDEDVEDIYAQLLRENCSTNLNSSGKKCSFYPVKTHISNCSFILHRTDIVCPAELCHRLYQRLLSTSDAESRHVLRLMPVVNTCRSDLPVLYTCLQQVWSQFLGLPSDELNPKNTDSPESEIKIPLEETCAQKSCVTFHVPKQTAGESTLKGPKTFMIIFKARGYKAITRDDAIHATIKAIKSVDSSWEICNSSPSVVISITVLCKITCISLLENFFTYRKYNVAEIFTPSTVVDKTEQS
uniref:THUMP domain-containing protein n=1 Tax=Trichobilharzia regenti TaxID=157069 RepID=A0AA85J9X4_TRIRE|nr:unnamed protein product [Trichobilharzia regenti]